MKTGQYKGQGDVERNRFLKIGEIQITTNPNPYSTRDFIEVSAVRTVSRDLRDLPFVSPSGSIYQSAKLMNLPSGFYAFLKVRNTQDE